MTTPTGTHGGKGAMRPFYEAAMRETMERGDVAAIRTLLDEAKLIKRRFGNVDAAIAELETALKRV